MLENLLDFDSGGPCKLRRVHGSFLYIARDRPSDRMRSVATEVPAYDVLYTESLDEYVHAKTFNHIFSAFELVPDGSGRAWQLLYRAVPPPRKGVDEAPLERGGGGGDLVLGMLPDENGVAGLVPRTSIVDEHGTTAPTPGSQVIVRREGLEAPYVVAFENVSGLLHFNTKRQRYEFGSLARGPDVVRLAGFHVEKILDMTRVSAAAAPLAFVRYPKEPTILILPPPDVTAADFEQKHRIEIEAAKRRRLPIETILKPPHSQQHHPPEPTSYRFALVLVSASILFIVFLVSRSSEAAAAAVGPKRKRKIRYHH